MRTTSTSNEADTLETRSDNTLAIQRLCPYCCTPDVAYLSKLPFPDENPVIEDEAHVLSTCPVYHHVRLMLPDDLKTALLKRDYHSVFGLISYDRTAFMIGNLDVLYAIYQLNITFVTYIFKITSLTFLFFRRAHT